MTYHQPFFYLVRLVLETCTPLSIATGYTNGIADNLIVRDANGLPAIPGSSLAGVLRHLYWRTYNNKEETEQLFGCPKQTQEQKSAAENPSFVHVSWGCLHDSNNKPVEGLLDFSDAYYFDDNKLFKDELLKEAQQAIPIKRDHVKLTHRGVSDTKKQGKFERISLTKGHRFSIELSLWSHLENDPSWHKLLNLLQRPDFRLGGGTRRGLGQLKLIKPRCYMGMFNLQDKEQFKKFSQLTESLVETRHLQPFEFVKTTNTQGFSQCLTLELTPLDGYSYRFGGGLNSLNKNSQPNSLTAITESCVKWKNDRGELTEDKQVVIPASSVKGALSHRVAYHYNALIAQFADEITEPDQYAEKVKNYVGESNEAVQALFGYVIEKEEQQEIAQVGCLIFNDIYLDYPTRDTLQTVEYPHNSVDRFTGGVLEGALFFEEMLTDTKSFVLNITLIENELPFNILKALLFSLNDLIEARLALGAGGGRGHGYFKGEWLMGKEWLELQIKKDNNNAAS